MFQTSSPGQHQTDNPSSIYLSTQYDSRDTEVSPQVTNFHSAQDAMVRVNDIEQKNAAEVLHTQIGFIKF